MFTVIICTYNGERTIKKAIDSIIYQTKYNELVDKLIIVDNNSKDNTKQVVNNYSTEKYNIIYSFEKKQGLSNARLNGVNMSHSEWIIFVDDDNELMDNWLIESKAYIDANENIGAFNGVVVPKFDYELNDTEATVLNVIYKGLACTHINEKDIDILAKKHPNGKPFGAGLVIKASCLKKLSTEGWLTLKGRTKNILTSGEDTEMCDYVIKQGYNTGYNPKMLLYHYIPKFRLTKGYAIKLYSSFAYSYYLSANNKSFYILRRLNYLIKSIIVIIRNRILLLKQKNELRLIIDIEKSKTLISCVLRDFIILKIYGD